jgi:hypothetical protein
MRDDKIFCTHYKSLTFHLPHCLVLYGFSWKMAALNRSIKFAAFTELSIFLSTELRSMKKRLRHIGYVVGQVCDLHCDRLIGAGERKGLKLSLSARYNFLLFRMCYLGNKKKSLHNSGRGLIRQNRGLYCVVLVVVKSGKIETSLFFFRRLVLLSGQM